MYSLVLWKRVYYIHSIIIIDMYMRLLGFSNGDFPRSRVIETNDMNEQTCQLYANNDWNLFSQLIEESPPGNNGFIYIDRYVAEITPDSKRCGTFIFNSNGESICKLSPSQYCRGIIESQVLSMRFHLEKYFY